MSSSKAFILTVILASLAMAPTVFAGIGDGSPTPPNEEEGRAAQRQQQQQVEPQQQEEQGQVEARQPLWLPPLADEQGPRTFQGFPIEPKFKSQFIGDLANLEISEASPAQKLAMARRQLLLDRAKQLGITLKFTTKYYVCVLQSQGCLNNQ